MIVKFVLFIGIFAACFLISSASKLSPPGNFSWPLDSPKLCFAARFNLSLNFQYLKTDGNNATVNIPLDEKTYETFSVSCDNATSHEMTLFMMSGLTALFLHFKVDANHTASLTHVAGYFTINDLGNFFPNFAPSVQGTYHFSVNESAFEAIQNKSYQCNSKTTIDAFSTNANASLSSIEFENLRIQPFIDQSQKFDDFADAEICSADDEKSSNLVPIIVGASLAVLVIIVLVAYMIGRRRGRNGYQSV